MKSITQLSLVGLLAVSALAFAVETLTVDKLVQQRETLDGKTVTVTGVVSNFAAKTSKAGNKYTTFTLKGSNTTLSAYTQGHIEKAPNNGDEVEITGSFRKEKVVNPDFTVKNEVDFTEKKNTKYGIKIVKRKDDK